MTAHAVLLFNKKEFNLKTVFHLNPANDKSLFIRPVQHPGTCLNYNPLPCRRRVLSRVNLLDHTKNYWKISI